MQNGKARPGPASSDGMAYFIKFLSGPREGDSLPLTGERITIGRRKDSTISIDDGKLSGIHAEFIFEGGVPVVRDLGSTNGVFVDGRKIDEMVLSDGDRIRVGQSDLVITTGSPVPSPGEAGAAGGPGENGTSGDLDAVRVIRDIRPGRRGVGSLVLLVLLLLALGASGYYYFFLGNKTGMAGTVEPSRGNLAAKGWSFETPSDKDNVQDVWIIEGNSPQRFSKASGRSRSGAIALKAALSAGGFALARRGETIPVNSRNRYRASLHASIQGDLVVGLKAVFYGRAGLAGSGTGERVPITGPCDLGFSRNDDGAYHLIEGGIFPPPGAEEMELMISAAGRGTAYVDDLEVFEASSLDAPVPINRAQMELRRSQNGFEVFRSTRCLMTAGRLQVVRETEAGAEGGRTETIPSEASGFGGSKGLQFAGPGVGLLDVAHSLVEKKPSPESGDGLAPESGGRLAPVSGGRLAASVTVDGAGGAHLREILYCFDMTSDYAESGVGLLTADDYVTFSQAFPPTKALAVVFGGPHERMRVDFGSEARLSGIVGTGGALSVVLHLEPQPQIDARFDIQCDFSPDEKAAGKLLSGAKAAEGKHCFGLALSKISKIEVSYRFIESVYKQAVAVKGRILVEKKRLLDSIQERLKSAVFLQNPELFDRLESFCGDCLTAFPEDVDFTAQLDRIREQSKELRQTIDDEQAESYYKIVCNLKAAKNRPETLAVLLSHMQEAFPRSEWTRKALEEDQEKDQKEDQE
jgi:hypothetical protein